jgi:hypothetical protein
MAASIKSRLMALARERDDFVEPVLPPKAAAE